MSLFRLDASIRAEGSHSSGLADLVEREWREANPFDAVVRRQLGVDPIPSTAWAAAIGAGATAEADRTPEQRAAVALATDAVDQLIGADAFLFAVPLYNFGVSQHFKTWVDLVLTDPRMPPVVASPLEGKPAVLAVVRGGNYGSGTPREGWDHSTGWIRRILEDVWKLDLKVVEKEFTLVGVNPALDGFKDLAVELHEEAERVALAHGRAFAGSLV
jgi:FMN-dependent NADH-azoreductase